MHDSHVQLKRILRRALYEHPQVRQKADEAYGVLTELFEQLFSSPDLIPDDYVASPLPADEQERAQLVADYVAGMTDRFALTAHAELRGARATAI